VRSVVAPTSRLYVQAARTAAQLGSIRYDRVIGTVARSIALTEQYFDSESSIARSTSCEWMPSPRITYSR
jgi:hypothetical protein